MGVSHSAPRAGRARLLPARPTAYFVLDTTRSPERPSPKRKGCLLGHCPLPPPPHRFLLFEERDLQGYPTTTPSPSHLRNPSDRAPPTGYWGLANPELSSPTRRHALRADALQHLWEARHAGGYACGHPSPPPLSIPSHSRWVEAPASRELGEGALWLAPALRSRFQVARGPCTLHFFGVIANSGPRKQSK